MSNACLFHFVAAGSLASLVEEKLISDLLENYNKKARPVTDDSQSVVVTFDIALPKLMKVVNNEVSIELEYVFI